MQLSGVVLDATVKGDPDVIRQGLGIIVPPYCKTCLLIVVIGVRPGASGHFDLPIDEPGFDNRAETICFTESVLSKMQRSKTLASQERHLQVEWLP
jgi:hypothetical protein